MAPVVSPALFYDDASAALDWLESVLGFTKVLVVPGEGGKIVHSELKLGDSFVMVANPKPHRGTPKAPFCLYVYLGDDAAFDSYLAGLKSKGVSLQKDAYNTEYGSKEFELQDKEGNTWSFGTYELGSYKE